VVLVGWREERRASRRHLHRPDWRCVDRLAIARDSGRRTCCAAEANAGGQRCGEEIGGWVGVGGRVMAEHGAVVVAGSDCIASVGVAGGGGAGLLLGTRRRTALMAAALAAARWAEIGGVVDVRSGCNAMQWVLGRAWCTAVYIRVDRRAQCEVVLTTSMLLAVLLLLASCFHASILSSPNRRHHSTQIPSRTADRKTLHPDTMHHTLPRDGVSAGRARAAEITACMPFSLMLPTSSTQGTYTLNVVRRAALMNRSNHPLFVLIPW
jgi:hypothetical protein